MRRYDTRFPLLPRCLSILVSPALPVKLDFLNMVPDAHFKVQDASGQCITIEPRGGELVIHDSPVRALKNRQFHWKTPGQQNARFIDLTEALTAAGDKMLTHEMGPQNVDGVSPSEKVQIQ